MGSIKFVVGLFVLGVVLSLSVDANAQRRIISEREYMLPFSHPMARVWEMSRRVETTDETFVGGSVVKSAVTITEILLPDREHLYTKKTEGGVVSEFELITIQFMQYTRKDGGPWSKVDLRVSGGTGGFGGGMGIGKGTGLDASAQNVQYSVEDVVLNGKRVRLYEAISTSSDTNEPKFNEVRRWLHGSGLPNREETVSGKLSPREETAKRVTTFEYDPAIKIEAPQMK